MKYKLDSEGEICGGIEVMYKGKKYTTGNRYNGTVELWDGNKFVRVVKVLNNFTFRKL